MDKKDMILSSKNIYFFDSCFGIKMTAGSWLFPEIVIAILENNNVKEIKSLYNKNVYKVVKHSDDEFYAGINGYNTKIMKLENLSNFPGASIEDKDNLKKLKENQTILLSKLFSLQKHILTSAYNINKIQNNQY